MRTPSTKVKDKRVAQGDATRSALVRAGRELFGQQGYAETSTDEVVALAGVTKGALYHHFAGKEDLFRAVFEQVQREVSDQAVVEFLAPDSWQALVRGCGLWVDAHLDPSVRRIVMHDARAVLGWEDVRAIENRFGAVALRGALRKAMHAGAFERQPLRPLALILIGALSEGCLYIADAEDPVAARAEVGGLITRMLSAFRPESAT
ncbi:MAG: transcriptional regulator, TetR family [Acidimicrobiales bacterium]|nr:transcriptional regulator, TetR family [Acidimicrobiales bacterium]